MKRSHLDHECPKKALPPSTLQRLVTHTSCTCKSKNSTSLDVRNATDSVASIKPTRGLENKENLSALSSLRASSCERVLAKKHECENHHHDGLMQGSFIAVVGVQKVLENRHFLCGENICDAICISRRTTWRSCDCLVKSSGAAHAADGKTDHVSTTVACGQVFCRESAVRLGRRIQHHQAIPAIWRCDAVEDARYLGGSFFCGCKRGLDRCRCVLQVVDGALRADDHLLGHAEELYWVYILAQPDARL
ncbi:hypothetical protein DyAD56_03795 [Dyella sp. AD56]|nr:hypothetical protein DyAD56_03795 [Dyella sp. AD56]